MVKGATSNHQAVGREADLADGSLMSRHTLDRLLVGLNIPQEHCEVIRTGNKTLGTGRFL